MAIKFLRNHVVEGPPREEFKEGQTVKDRSPESEMHFVRRGHAGFVGEGGKLFDHEGREITPRATAEVVNVAANRQGTAGRAGETALGDGTAQRASSGPGKAAVTTAVTEGEAKPKKKSGGRKKSGK